MEYDTRNVFAKILRGEIPASLLYEDAFAIAFPDLAPQAPTHILVIPKGAYMHYDDFMSRASDAEIAGFFRAVQAVARANKAEEAFRLITNNGEAAGQSVGHFHVHLLAGKPLGPLLAR